MKDPQYLAFTIKFPSLVNKLTSKIGISLPFDSSLNPGQPYPHITECGGIWDTGAEASVITKSFATQLGLLPSGKKTVYGVGDPKVENVYLINIYLPNKVVFHHVEVTECEQLLGGFGLLIGMDIIGKGDLSVSNNGFTTMSFRIPSIKHTDFVEQYNRERERNKNGIQKKELKSKRKLERQNKKKSRAR